MNTRLSGLVATTGRLAAALAVVFGTLGQAAPAVADTATFKDARNDSLGVGANIYNVRVVNEKFVRLLIKHDDLVRSFRSGASGTVYLDTDHATSGPEFAFVAGLYRGADYALVRTDGWDVQYDERVQGSYLMRLNYADDVTRIRIGRQALGSPSKVRVAVQTAGNLDNHTVEDWYRGKGRFTTWVARG